jgi:carbonic anhydrase/acetyltransferase-like protein (isoleucine patch superfamily)
VALGLLVYDVLFVALATILYGGAAGAGYRAFVVFSGVVPWPVALFPAFLIGILALIVEVSVLTFLCPRLKPGRYEMMKGAVFFGWIGRSILRRILFVPGLRWFIFSSNVLRFLAFRGLGARVAFTTNMSVDADILDPSLFVAGPGAVIGARCFISGHYVEDGKLVLGEVRVGKDSLLAAEVGCAPEVTIGDRVLVKARASISLGARVGDRAVLGGESCIDAYAVIGERATIANRVYVRPRVEVPAGAKITE